MSRIETFVGTALDQQGKPYELNAEGPGRFDCSGLVWYSARAAGVDMPRTAAQQQSACRPVSAPARGDLCFWGLPAHHVGIALGDGTMVVAPHPGEVVQIERIFSGGTFGRYDPLWAPDPSPAPTPDGPPWPGRYLRFPPLTVGDDVRTWQQRMADRGWTIAVDGQYGPASRAVCTAFQQEKGLQVDGIVGPQTWAAAWTAPIT